MKSWTTIVAITVAMLDCAGSAYAQDGGTSDAKAELATEIPKDVLEPFFKTYCIRCHGPEKQNGDVRFDQANWVIANSDIAQRWQDVLDVLNGGDMPPEDEKQPESAELAKALETLTGTLQMARDRLTSQGGEIILRRLNRREYANTIRDLFGFEINPLDVPPDNDSESFDTVGSDQVFTSSTFDRYLELGERIATQAFRVGATPRLESEISRQDYGAGQAKGMQKKIQELDRLMAMKKAGATWQEMGFTDAGDAKNTFRFWEGRRARPVRYLKQPRVDEGAYLTDFGGFHAHGMAKMSRAADPRGTYRVRLRGGIHGNQPEIRRFVGLSTPDRGLVDTFRLQGAPEAPQIIETELRPRLGERTLQVWFYENRQAPNLDVYVKALKSKGPRCSIWVDWLEIEGPFYGAERSFFETLTFEESSGKGRPKLTLTDETAQEWIERFAFEAFRRRQPAPAYLEGLATIFKTRRQEGQSLEEAMSAVVSIILSSPGFLYLQEHVAPEPTALAAGNDGLRTDGGPRLTPSAHNSGGRQTLDDRELAERLAYFLWSSPPDAALYAQVENGTLSQEAVLRTEVDRMLADPKAEALYEGFVTQWGDLKRFEAVTVDERYSSRFNKGVRHSASRELPAFFKVLVEENLPAANLIDSDFAVVDPLLAQHYGIDGVDGVESNGFQKVALRETSPRGGLLGQAAFLVSGSNGERSSPVIRGALVMQKLLHDKPAPPPPNVPELGAEAGVNRSNRELVEFHQRKPQCASCHKKMDVIGFGLENFDTIGQWRDTERVGKKDVPIQTGGELPDGGKFANLNDLKRLLRDQDDQLAEELVESLLAYGLGRNIEFTDTDAVEDILTRLESDQFRLRDMISEIAVSPIFRSK